VLAADQCPFLAGAVAYQFFFAIIPLMALAIGILGFIYGSERAVDELSAALRQVYPVPGNEELAVVRQLSEGRALALGVGLLGTIVTVTAIHGALDAAFAVVLGRAGERTFVRGKLEAFAFAGGCSCWRSPRWCSPPARRRCAARSPASPPSSSSI
jgi:uncharacterized BrkB/YihY/UPF0761 family membrane protein